MPASSSVLSMPKNFCEPNAQHWKIHRLPVTAPGCWQLMLKWRKRKTISTRFTNSGRRSKKKLVISRVHARDSPAVLPEINPAPELTLLQKDYGTTQHWLCRWREIMRLRERRCIHLPAALLKATDRFESLFNCQSSLSFFEMTSPSANIALSSC